MAEISQELSKLDTNVHARINRYEQMLWRQARQLVNTLESLGRRKHRNFRMNSSNYLRLR
jgi:hypothetical protein